MKKQNLTWLEIDSRAFSQNIKTIRKLAGKRLVAVAVKSNGYGHGLNEIISLLKKEKIEYIAVHSLEEASRARQAGWNREILVVGYVKLCDLAEVFRLNLELTVYNSETVTALGRLAEKKKVAADIHLKIETGTNRQGVEAGKLKKIVSLIKKYRYLHLKGISTHFANIEDTTDHSYANYQLGEFNRLAGQIEKMGLRPELRHTACSAALLLFEDTKFDLVRPGIAVYGLWPSKETYLSYRLAGGSNGILRPVLAWKTRVIQVKDVPADAFIGYGCTYRTSAKTRLAILPVGYSDGYDRSLSNLAHVLIKGKRAPIRGRICMNLMMADITDIPGVKLEDEVTLLGRDGRENLTADQMAAWAQTVNYEIISRINEQIPRIIV
ncbi:Alanine racemase [Candidatus Zixiibacteriota bacterium]|nr:Alanine racemase [candidate division Zixibacteria bacterium]